MKQIIDGLTYNTETADHIGKIGSATQDRRDFNFWSADLYRTKRGRYFMHGEGGARSPFLSRIDANTWSGGNGIVALSHDEALAYAERDLEAEKIEMFFEISEA